MASFNRFQTAKHFTKLNSLKLLDLSFNKISDYEELICLTFVKSLVVLNITNNPIVENDKAFTETIKNIV